jgi:putative transposase
MTVAGGALVPDGVGRLSQGRGFAVKILKGFKVELDPNNAQRTLLLKAAGVARFCYNWGLQKKKEAIESKVKPPSAFVLGKQLNAVKRTEFPWMQDASKCIPEQAFRDLDVAFKRFWGGRKSKRRVGFPRFKSRSKGIGSFRFNDCVKLPRLGTVRLTRTNYIPTGSKPLSVSVSERAGRWFVSVLMEVEVPEYAGSKDSHDVVGVDLGVKALATVSDGSPPHANPRALGSKLRKLRRLQRSVSRKQKGSANRKKAVRKVATLHYRVANVRKDTLHKLTTTLAKTKRVVVIEGLAVANMMKNRCLARAIGDVGMGEFRRQLEYKAPLYGCRIVVADRFFASSKKCSCCGVVRAEMSLRERTWRCESCGTTHDRDLNASINLEHVAAGSAGTSKSPVDGGALASRQRKAKLPRGKQELSGVSVSMSLANPSV